jgi:hypothetical protein
MPSWFQAGGVAMWPTMFLGMLTVAAGASYAVRPQRRTIPVVASLSITTVLCGFVGFVTGLIKSLGGLSQVGPDERWISLLGLGESLVNVAFALALVGMAALAVVVGTWRLARWS